NSFGPFTASSSDNYHGNSIFFHQINLLIARERLPDTPRPYGSQGDYDRFYYFCHLHLAALQHLAII
ncbi:MAG: hypothetical protein ABJN04_14465, partial [Hyphomicrobiales bacterium]